MLLPEGARLYYVVLPKQHQGEGLETTVLLPEEGARLHYVVLPTQHQGERLDTTVLLPEGARLHYVVLPTEHHDVKGLHHVAPVVRLLSILVNQQP